MNKTHMKSKDNKNRKPTKQLTITSLSWLKRVGNYNRRQPDVFDWYSKHSKQI